MKKNDLLEASKDFKCNIHDEPFFCEFNNKKICIVHHPDLINDNLIRQADFIFHGHTHRYRNEIIDKTIIFNPGECAGFLKGKNHGIWSSYNQDGTKKAEGTFENGKKIGAWFFWNDAVLIEVIYKNNSIQKAIQWDKSEVIALKDD